MRGGGLNRACDLGDAGVLGEVAAGTGRQGIEDRCLVGMCRQHHNLGIGVCSPYLPGRLHPVELRHPQIHQHDIGPVLGAQRDRLLPV